MVDISENQVYNIDGEHNKFIALLNPFRYRGCYFDSETNLYFLPGRYYDPEIGRWISADSIGIATILGAGIIGGLNLYSYCFCDPVNYVDYGGYFPRKNTDPNFKWHIDNDGIKNGVNMEHLQLIIKTG